MKKNRLLLLLLCLFVCNAAIAQWTNVSTLNTKVRDTAGMNGSETKVATAPNGYSFISWAESGPTGYQYKLQLVDTAGYNVWAPQGIVIDTAIGSALYRYDMKADKAGNVIIAFQNRRSGTNKPVVYKVNQAGSMLWGATGLQLTDTSSTSGLSPNIAVTDSNNVIIAWSASGTKTFVSVVKITEAGTLRWADNLRIIDRVTTKKYERGVPVIVGGEQFVLQYVERTGSGLGVSTMYAQKYNTAAAEQWTLPTKVSTKNIGFAYFPAPQHDGFGGIFLSFTTSNPSSASLSDVYVQRVYADGHIWDPAGYEAVAGTGTHRFDAGAAYIPAINKYLVTIKYTNSAQSSSGIMLQKVDTAGAMLIANGSQLTPPSSGLPADIVNVTGTVHLDTSVVILYQIGSTPSPITIKALRADTAGNNVWGPSGVTVSDNASDKGKFGISDYIKKQLVTVWADQRAGNGGVYAQNIRKNGSLGNPPVCPVITIAPPALPGDTIGKPYSATFTQTGGVGQNIAYTISSGTLPTGLTLSSGGLLSGTTTATGTSTFTVTATDSNGCTGSATYTFTTSCPIVTLAELPSICDTVVAYALTGGLPSGGVYLGQHVTGSTFNAQAAGPGTYTIRYTYPNAGCHDTATRTIIVHHCSTGITSVGQGEQFRVFPNPATDAVTLVMNGITGAATTVRIISVTGQVMLQEHVKNVNGNIRRTYDLSRYARGIYILETLSDKGIARSQVNLQ